MKSRPRRVENRVAEEFNKLFSSLGLGRIERIPAPGREGPDMTWNELKLIIDPKSWLTNPKNHMIVSGYYDHGPYVSIKLDEFLTLLNGTAVKEFRKSSSTVLKLLEHLDSWTKENVPEGISAIVLHWPHMRIANSVVVIKVEDVERLQERYTLLIGGKENDHT